MKFTQSLLFSVLFTILLLPGCNWFGCGCNQPKTEIVTEEVLAVAPEETSAQELPTEDLDMQLPDSEK